MTGEFHVVLDETAMIAIGAGNRLMSSLLHSAHYEEGWRLYAPACAMVEADRFRAGLAEHVAMLPAVTVVDLGLPATLALGGRETTWGQAHARFAAEPNPDMPDGAYIATAEPKRWDGLPVRILDLT